ncbi:MAG TPA: amidase [Candidatus Dormibacteraeota bacterium]
MPDVISAREIAAGVRGGRLDPVEVAREHLARIVQMDGTLHAFTVVRDEALGDAAHLAQSGLVAALPLAGVPVAVKDSFGLAGLPAGHGSRAASAAPAERDDELVRRLRAAGAIIIGKTSMPELAIWPFTEGPGWATRNPALRSRTCGGSSGGSAVAVATGMAALAVGTDGGGSIRIPAACCGVVGVKPTPGQVPLPGDAVDHWYGCTAAGPLARDVADAALLLDVLRGHEPAPPPEWPQRALRIAVSLRHPVLGAPVDERTQATIRRVAQLLRSAGHAVHDEDPPYPRLPLRFARCYLAGIAEDAEVLSLDVGRAEARTRSMVRIGRWIRDRGWDRAASRDPAGRRLRHWIRKRDAAITPVVAYPPPPVGRWARGGWLRTGLSVDRWMGFNQPWNLAGCPAVVVPVPGDGALRVGVQLAGPPGAERRLLELAVQVEALASGQG